VPIAPVAAAAPIVAAAAASTKPKKVEKVEKKVVPPPPPKKKDKVVAAAAPVAPAAAAAGGSIWKWLLPLLLLLLLLLGLLYFLKACDGCGGAAAKTAAVATPKKETPVVDKKDPPPPPPTAYCEAGNALGYSGVEGEIAAFLNEPGKGSKDFVLNDTKFGRNSVRLNSAGTKQLDKIAKICGACPDIQMEIYGSYGDGETSSYRGSKEKSIADERAQSAYRHLTKRDVAPNRMTFEGGDPGSRNIKIRITKR